MPGNEIERNPLIRGRLYKFLNLGLCFMGIIFVVIGVFKSTLLLYIGCALVGAAVGGFIRSRLPIHAMVPSTGVHLVYRSEVRRNVPAYNNGSQTYVIMHSQQPCGIGQKKINQFTSVTKYLSDNTAALNSDSIDTVSVISSITEKVDSSDNYCIVCLIQFKNGQEVRQLPCQHMFHINCIDKWLKINRLCPTCRSDVTLPPSSKEAMTSSVQRQECINSDEEDGTPNDRSNEERSPSSSVVDIVAATENEAREDQVGDDADVMQELASTSRDVVIHVASDNIVSL